MNISSDLYYRQNPGLPDKYGVQICKSYNARKYIDKLKIK